MSRTNTRTFPSPIEALEGRQLLASVGVETRPLVSISAPDNVALRDTADYGRLVVSRSGDLSADLTIPLLVGGTAENGVDYGRVGRAVTIPAGRDSVSLYIRPVDGPVARSEFVSVTLGEVEGYNYDRRSASVAIQDNESSAPPVFSPLRIETGRRGAFGRSGFFVISRRAIPPTR